jgi:adhesin/invasin
MKKYIVLFFVLFSLLFLSHSAFAVTNTNLIKINIQPASVDNVDSILSQQPVLLVTDSNNNPIKGVTVTAITNGSGDLGGDLAKVTDSKGLATFTDLSYSGTDSFQIIFGSSAGKAVSSFIKLSPGKADASKSSVSAMPLNVVADGQSLAIVKVKCVDQYGNIIPGADVGITTSGSNNVLSRPDLVDEPGMTNVNLSSTKAESKIISVTVGGISIGKPVTINFTSGKIEKLSILADSPVNTDHSSKIVITGKDKFDNLVSTDSATKVTLWVDNGGALDSALVTLENGVAEALVSKKTPGVVNLIAVRGEISDTAKITFNPADTVSPVVLSQYPIGGVENMALNIVPFVNFSKTMDAITITNDNIQLRKLSNNSSVPATISISNGVKQVKLQPEVNLSLNEKYYLYVSKGVIDLAGNALAIEYNGDSFSTSISAQNDKINQIKDINSETPSNVSPESGSIANSSDLSLRQDSNSILVKTGTINPSASNALTSGAGEPKDNLSSYAGAGILGAFTNINISKFGDWFVENFKWIIFSVVVLVVIYIFWFKYIKE